MAESTTATITEKLAELVKKTDAWREVLAKAAKEQQTATKETTTLMEKLSEAMEDSIKVAQMLSEKVESVGAAAARMRAEFQQTTGAASNAFNLEQSRNTNPFTAADYISGASMLTTEQKAEFLRIVTDQDKSALDTLLDEYKKQINEIYTDEYQSIKKEKDQLDQQRTALGEKIQSELAAIKGKESSGDYRSTIKLIEKQRMEMSMLGNKSDLLTQRIGQFDQAAQRIEGQMAVISRAWDDNTMRLTLASGARGTESQGYSKDELLWLVNKALETGAGSKVDNVVLTELIKKLNSSIPEKLYKLDLTAGDQKLSAFTELSPEKFLDALLKARGTAI